MRRKTHEDFVKEVYEIVGEEYTVTGKYQTAKKLLDIKHNICGNEWCITPDNFIRGNRCPVCFSKRRGKSRVLAHDVFIEKVNNIHGDEYTVLGKYELTRRPILVRHNICGREFNVIPNNFLRGTTCLKCSERKVGDKHTLSIEEVRSRIYKMVGDSYIILEYKGYNEDNIFKHNECGNIYEASLANFVGGKRCPICSQSKGEELLFNILKSNNVTFKREYKFEDCRLESYLRFDFAVFSGDDLKFLIEYDGIQHFEPVKAFGGISEFNKIKKRDTFKNEYCMKNRLTLIRIPYTMNYEVVKQLIEDKLKEIS